MPRLKPSAPREPVKLKVKKGDLVEVISGKDKGKRGEVTQAMPKENKVIVKGANMMVRHTKDRPNRQRRRQYGEQRDQRRPHRERSASLRRQSHGGLPRVQAPDPRRL